MTLLVLGGNGQLGHELRRALAPLGPVIPTTRTGLLADGIACERADFDEPASLASLLDRLLPSVVVNAAAYTAVDRAEQEPEAARRANTEAPGVIARWCARRGVPYVHYSTDYVFDGQSRVPYREDAPTAPLNVYGMTKRDGEDAIRAAAGHHLIFRTAGAYAEHSANFLSTMLRVGAERDVVRVVADQIGTPTPAALIADVTAHALQHAGRLSGTWHLTATGETSWYGFAEAIFAEAIARGVLPRAPRVEAITTAEYPTPAPRPAYSRLDVSRLQRDFDLTLPSWQEGLAQVMARLQPR